MCTFTCTSINHGKVHTGKFAIFSDFPIYGIDSLFENNQILSQINNSQNGFVGCPNHIKMFFTNLNRGNQGSDDEVWSSVKGTKIVLNCEILGIILDCKKWGIDLSSFEINEHYLETFHDIFEWDGNFEFKNHNFRPKARIVNLLFQYTITLRSGNFNNPTLKLCKTLFAIFGNYDINWCKLFRMNFILKIWEWWDCFISWNLSHLDFQLFWCGF